jgi:hypothetical protein
MPGVWCTRGLGKKCPGRATGSPGSSRHSLRDGFTVSFVLSLATGLSCHHRYAKINPRNLTPASGRQDHTTSPYAIASFVRAQKTRDDAKASTASRLAQMTIMIRPSVEAGRLLRATDLPGKKSEIFSVRDWTGFARPR